MSALIFLSPIGRQRARKVHRLVQSAAGTRLETTPYDKPKAFRFQSEPIADIEDVLAALERLSSREAFAIRGAVRPDLAPTAIINRRFKGLGASIEDVPSAVLPVDLDQELAPKWLDTSDIKAVGGYLRSRLPPELSDVSCVVQLSAGYGLSHWTGKPPILKARLWFLLQAPLDSAQLRAWFRACNATGKHAKMDEAVAGCNQPVYTAAPVFENCADPVPERLALLLGERDEAVIRPPAEPRSAFEPSEHTQGERCPERLAVCVRMIEGAADGEKHTVLNRAAYLAGGYVAGGACTEDEARQALQAAIRRKPNVADLQAAFETIESALHDGMAQPLGVLLEIAKPVELERDSIFEGDLKRLAKAPPAQVRATAKAIIGRYSWRCPWRMSWEHLGNAIVANLPKGSPANLGQWLKNRLDRISRQTRKTAEAQTAIDSCALSAAGIGVVEVDSIAEARKAVEARPECLMLVKAELGTGKTEGILKPLALAAHRVVAITHRVSLVDDLASRLQLENYKTLRAKDAESCGQLGMCINSITNPKFSDALFHAKTILIDEISSVVRECHNTHGTLKKHAKATWERLAWLLKKPVAVGVDADLSTRDVLALKEATGRAVCVVIVKPKPAPLSAEFGDYRQIWQEILEAVGRGEAVRVATDSATQVRKLEALIKDRYPDRRVMAIHAANGVATNGRADVLALLKNINGVVQDVDVLIHSPCVESGVSLTVPHFTRTFGIYCGSVSPAAFVQMLRRDRTATRFEIGILNNGRKFEEASAPRILANMEATHRRTVELGRDEAGFLMRLQPASPWDGRVAEYKAVGNIAGNCYAQNLWVLLESREVKCSQLGSVAHCEPEAMDTATNLTMAHYREAITNAPDLDEKSRQALEAVYQPSPEQSAAMARYDLKTTLAVGHVDAPALDVWDEGTITPKIARFEALVGAPLEGLAADKEDSLSGVSVAARASRLAKAEAFRTAFEVAGFDPKSGAGTVTRESALETFKNLAASPVRPVLEHAGLCRFSQSPKYPIRWLSNLLEKFGLILVQDARPGTAGPRGRVYRLAMMPVWDTAGRRLKTPGWNAMSTIAERRSAGYVQIGSVKTINPRCGRSQAHGLKEVAA